MKILLLFPTRDHYCFGNTPQLSIEVDSGNYPPMGLLSLAGYIEKHTDYEVCVCDAPSLNMNFDDVIYHIGAQQPDILGLYVSTYYLLDTIKIAKEVKKNWPDIKIVAGGPHATIYPWQTIDIQEIDYVVCGDGEKAFTKLAKYLEEDELKAIDTIPNALTKDSPKNKEIIRERIENLDELPFPARHLIDNSKYSSILAIGSPMTTVITSRGCPFKCYFCSKLDGDQKFHYRSANHVVDELEEIVSNYKIRDFLFFDELFTCNKKRVIEICDEIVNRKLNIRWNCRSRVDVLDEETVDKMKKAGCNLIQFGVETGTERMQNVINKKIDLEKARKTIAMVYDKGIHTYANFMIGLPTESDEETKKTVEYAKSLKADYVVFGIFAPIPKSVFYEQGLKEGRFHDFWMDYVNDPKQIMNDYTWTLKDKDKYQKIIVDAYRDFYTRPSYIMNHLFRTNSLKHLLWQAKSALKIFF
ncbi:MAG: radical SAM protein [Elusimicrobiota bacterium]